MVLDRGAASLDGVTAVVTGGGSGIGRGIANGLAAFGARVAIWERDAATAAAAGDEVGGLACTADVREPDEVDAALARTIAELGVPTVLVNNAGGVFHSPLLDTAPKGWDALIRSNLTHLLLCTQRVARAMVDAGLPGSHRQRHLDRGHPRRARLRRLRGRQGRRGEPHRRRPPSSWPSTASG